MSSQRHKMLAGEMCDPLDAELVPGRVRARDLCRQLTLACLILLAIVVGLLGQGCRRMEVNTYAAAPHRSRPIVGAIRWDAWIGDAPGSDVGRQVERSLGPERWHSRLPFFARVVSPQEVQVRANRQEVMDTEISYAAAAGLDYWAFVMYDENSPLTRGGLDLYLQSTRRARVRFSMMVQSYTFDDRSIGRLVRYFRDARYQRVAGGRPLVFLLGPRRVGDPEWPDVAERVAQLRKACSRAGLHDPYIVHMWGWDEAKRVVDWLGLDAIGAYSMNFDDLAASYAVLAEKTEARWDVWRATGAKVFPLVTAGWDRRPRVEHPVSWEPPNPADAIERYYQPPTPDALAAHLRASLDWCARHPDAADAWGVVIYAWNEVDEGGWLVPSLWPDQGTSRLDAIGKVLHSWRR